MSFKNLLCSVAARLAVLILLLGLVAPAPAKERVEAWKNPDYDFSALRKVILLPVSADLTAGRPSSVKPPSQQTTELMDWAISAALKELQPKTPVTKTLDALLKDMAFVYGAPSFDAPSLADAPKEAREDFYRKAADMGFQALLQIEVVQKMETVHVPERTHTRTVYKEVEVRDAKGRLKEKIRIPEEQTEILPAYDEDYLHTRCMARLYDLSLPEGDHVAAAEYALYRLYQGGPVMKVVENALKASLKHLFRASNSK